MKILKPTMNSFKGNSSEEAIRYLNSTGIRKIMQDLLLRNFSSLHSNYLLKTTVIKKKNEKYQNLLLKFQMLQDCRMIFTLIYSIGVLIMRQELVQEKLYSFGMLEQVVFQGYVRVSHLLVKIKKITLDNNNKSLKHPFSQV